MTPEALLPTVQLSALSENQPPPTPHYKIQCRVSRYCANVKFSCVHQKEQRVQVRLHSFLITGWRWIDMFTPRALYSLGKQPLILTVFVPQCLGPPYHTVVTELSWLPEPDLWLQYLGYVMWHYSECVFWLRIFKSDGKCSDGTVSWSSPVNPLGFRCSGRTT